MNFKSQTKSEYFFFNRENNWALQQSTYNKTWRRNKCLEFEQKYTFLKEFLSITINLQLNKTNCFLIIIINDLLSETKMN